MAQHHKGERVLIQTRLPVEVHDEIRRRIAAAGTRGGVSQYIADWICLHVDRPDLVRELNRFDADEDQGLPLAI